MATGNFADYMAKTQQGIKNYNHEYVQKGYDGTTYLATVVEVNNAKKGDTAALTIAKVKVHGVHDDLSDDELKLLPWSYIALGQGNSKTAGQSPVLYEGQIVEVEAINPECTQFHIIKLMGFHKPKEEKSNQKGGAASSGGQNSATTPAKVTSVEPAKKDNTIDVKLENEVLSELPIQNLATGFINSLVCGIFSKINNELTALESKANAALERLMRPFQEGLQAIHDLEMAIDFIEPVLSTGILDFTKDMLRMVDINMSSNCSIGNIGGVIKIDGWSIDYKDYDFTSVTGKSIEIDLGGEIRLQKGLDVGLHASAFIMKKKASYWSVIDALPNPIKIGAYAAMIGQMQPVIITHIVVPDMSKLDFSLSIPFIDLSKPFIIGPDFESDLIPKFKLKVDAKGTDKATFGQLQVISGPSELTPSIELDFSLGPFKDKSEDIGNKKG